MAAVVVYATVSAAVAAVTLPAAVAAASAWPAPFQHLNLPSCLEMARTPTDVQVELVSGERIVAERLSAACPSHGPRPTSRKKTTWWSVCVTSYQHHRFRCCCSMLSCRRCYWRCLNRRQKRECDIRASTSPAACWVRSAARPCSFGTFLSFFVFPRDRSGMLPVCHE